MNKRSVGLEKSLPVVDCVLKAEPGDTRSFINLSLDATFLKPEMLDGGVSCEGPSFERKFIDRYR